MVRPRGCLNVKTFGKQANKFKRPGKDDKGGDGDTGCDGDNGGDGDSKASNDGDEEGEEEEEDDGDTEDSEEGVDINHHSDEKDDKGDKDCNGKKHCTGEGRRERGHRQNTRQAMQHSVKTCFCPHSQCVHVRLPPMGGVSTNCVEVPGKCARKGQGAPKGKAARGKKSHPVRAEDMLCTPRNGSLDCKSGLVSEASFQPVGRLPVATKLGIILLPGHVPNSLLHKVPKSGMLERPKAGGSEENALS